MSTEHNKYHQSKEDIAFELQMILAAQNNPAHFKPLYDKYYKPVFLFIYKRIADNDITADITSQVFLAALIHLKKYKSQGFPFSAWLYRIAINKINMYYRKVNKQRVVTFSDEQLKGLNFSEAEGNNSKVDDTQLLKALSTLPQDNMLLIELRFFEERSFLEIGQIVGITENNAKVKVYRILDKLKALLLKLGNP